MKTDRRIVAFLLALVLLTAMLPTAQAASKTYTGTINTDKVFFRLKPNTDAGYHGYLQKDTKVTVTGVSGDFYAVTYNGDKGYVMKKFVTLSAADQKALNGSSGAGSKYDGVTSIAKLGDPPACTQNGSSGDSVAKLQQALKIKGYYKDTVDGKFGQNTIAAVKAYQKAVGLSQTGKADSATIAKLFGTTSSSSSTTSSTTTSGKSYTGTINADDVFFRLKPNTSAGYHGYLQKNTKVAVTGVSGDFYAVTYNGDKGYVMKKFVTLSSADQKALNGSTTSGGGKYDGVTSISQLGDPPACTQNGSSGDSVSKLQQALKIKGYYKDTVDGKFGQNTIAAVKAYQKANGLSQTGKADYATILKLFGKVGNTTVSTDPKMNGITKISQITVPATSKKGDSGKDVLALQQALKIKGYYAPAIDSKYGDATVAAVKAFQKAKGLSQDGVAGNATIKALFGKNAADYTYVTERLDWFNGGRALIPQGALITIKDVSTGKTFTARHLFGANHLDAEPYTAADTATMKSIYGGAWSWNRRAILVKYNGHVYAASMNGMPHGSYTIKDNNFDGQFCIHFYNSKTHETNRVDPDHQNAVARAMNATW